MLLAFVPWARWEGKKASGSSPTHRPRPRQSLGAGTAGRVIVIGSGRADVSFVLVASGMQDRSVSRGTGERCPWVCLIPSTREAGTRHQLSKVGYI
jgi:hypothetical protein